jgi:L-seryl-tRNA(Ser) seleniumtransferase
MEIPLLRMLGLTVDALRARAEQYCARIPMLAIMETQAQTGGGALPSASLPSIAVAIETPYPDELLARLRAGDPPIVARVSDGAVLLDLRTIAPDEDLRVIRALTDLDDR